MRCRVKRSVTHTLVYSKGCFVFIYIYKPDLSLQEGEISFSEELFLDHKSPSMRHFLKSAIHLQFFKQVLAMTKVFCHLLDT